MGVVGIFISAGNVAFGTIFYTNQNDYHLFVNEKVS
jgi:hypothetical protein